MGVTFTVTSSSIVVSVSVPDVSSSDDVVSESLPLMVFGILYFLVFGRVSAGMAVGLGFVYVMFTNLRTGGIGCFRYLSYSPDHMADRPGDAVRGCMSLMAVSGTLIPGV